MRWNELVPNKRAVMGKKEKNTVQHELNKILVESRENSEDGTKVEKTAKMERNAYSTA